MRHHRDLLLLSVVLGLSFGVLVPAGQAQEVTKFARFQVGDAVAYGVVEGDRVRAIEGDPFGPWQPTQATYDLQEVTLLPPTQPSLVLALARNYRSHIGDLPDPEVPEPFLKAPSSLVGHGGNIVIPPGTDDVHYEAEMVIVIGKRTKNITPEEVPDHILGVTIGNDVSARDWQRNDIQWWRAKAADTFSPCGPFLVTGLDYNDLLLELRLNGEVKQSQRTRDLIHDVDSTVSFISQFMTLEPGDLIYTGTPGQTSAMKPGDVVEIELEGVGVLTNRVVAASEAGP